ERPVGSGGDRAGGRWLRGGVLRSVRAAHPRLPGSLDDRATARRSGPDSNSGHLPVPGDPTAFDDRQHASQHDAGRRDRRCPVRGGGIGIGDGADREPTRGTLRPLHVGLLYLPELAGAVLTAFALGMVINKRQMHYLPLVGMAFLAAGIAVFRIQLPPTQALALVGSGLTGIGLGATVAPALFVAGFSLPAANLQRVFAIVELFRAVAAFMIAPVFAHFAVTAGGNPRAGTGI